jgi:DNA polymerase-3 subunit gamma/tau
MAKQKASHNAPDAPPPGAPNAYTVLARRYRPQQFGDLVGQEAAAQALVNALRSNRVAHAYLFTGARGVGKTSTARILAKALNCVAGPTTTPCDACDICKSIAAGEDVDVLEIDGASNRGIDEVREIRSNVQYRPGRARFKIYIIDEVHMLTPPAFNALLKTLEEPPPHVKFIFATTEVQRIPVTILSRCQRFDFAGIGTPRIVERLRNIVTQEGMQADDEALELIARRAAGSMRDAQSLLDQLLAFGGERLSADQVHQLLGTANDDRVLALAGAVLDREPQRALQLVGEATDDGVQLGELLDQLIGYWRDLMVLSCAGSEARDLSVGPRHRQTQANQAASLALDSILAGLDILNTTRARLRGSNHGRALFEMALVRLSRLDGLVSLAQLGHWLQGAGRAGTSAGSTSPARPAVPPVSPPEGVKKNSLSAAAAPPAQAAMRSESARLALTPESMPALWQELLRQAAPMLAKHLEKAQLPAISGPHSLVLRFEPRYNAEYEYCQEPVRLQRIEELVRQITGQPCQVRIESAGMAAAAEAEKADRDADSSPRSRLTRAGDAQDPLLRRAIDVLGAQLVHVDEGFGTAPVAAADAAPGAEET